MVIYVQFYLEVLMPKLRLLLVPRNTTRINKSMSTFFLYTYAPWSDNFITTIHPTADALLLTYRDDGHQEDCFTREGANLQYATAAAFAFSVYGDLLVKYNQKVICGEKQFGSADLLGFAKKQVHKINKLESNISQLHYHTKNSCYTNIYCYENGRWIIFWETTPNRDHTW